jgi:hypothetical protein
MADEDTDLVPRSSTDTLADRRRLGRVDYQNRHLIELLRAPGEAPQPAEPVEVPADADAEADLDPDSPAPARGIMLGLLIGGGMWMAGGLITWLVF